MRQEPNMFYPPRQGSYPPYPPPQDSYPAYTSQHSDPFDSYSSQPATHAQYPPKPGIYKFLLLYMFYFPGLILLLIV